MMEEICNHMSLLWNRCRSLDFD